MPTVPNPARQRAERAADRRLAIWAETLYLINLLILPGLAFLALLWLYRRYYQAAQPLARNHLQQTLVASLWAGGLLLVVNIVILLLGGYQTAITWVIVILYFVSCHALLVLLGALGLSQAMNGKLFRYPLIGPALTQNPQ